MEQIWYILSHLTLSRQISFGWIKLDFRYQDQNWYRNFLKKAIVLFVTIRVIAILKFVMILNLTREINIIYGSCFQLDRDLRSGRNRDRRDQNNSWLYQPPPPPVITEQPKSSHQHYQSSYEKTYPKTLESLAEKVWLQCVAYEDIPTLIELVIYILPWFNDPLPSYFQGIRMYLCEKIGRGLNLNLDGKPEAISRHKW